MGKHISFFFPYVNGFILILFCTGALFWLGLKLGQFNPAQPDNFMGLDNLICNLGWA